VVHKALRTQSVAMHAYQMDRHHHLTFAAFYAHAQSCVGLSAADQGLTAADLVQQDSRRGLQPSCIVQVEFDE